MSLFQRKVRGFRLVDLVALGLLSVLILGVYLAKTIAGRERTEIAAVERQIAAEKVRIRLLQAEVTHLEQPARIEQLSETYLGLAPVSIKHETTVDALVEAARTPLARPVVPVVVAPAPPVAPAASPAAPAASPPEPAR